MSRALTIFVILSALATGSAIVLGLVAEPLTWGQFWPDFVRAVAVVSWIVGALVWCTERICREVAAMRAATSDQFVALRQDMDGHAAALREAVTKSEKCTQKRLRALENLTRERIEAAHQVHDLFEGRRRANDR